MKTIPAFVIAFVAFVATLTASGDTFGNGDNQFTIDFVTISGAASSANGTYIGIDKPEGFIDPDHDYRIGVYEVTNSQWDKFKASVGVLVTGDPTNAYDEDPYWTGANIPANEVSWYEAAQFVNWLNTSAGHQAAYKFTGTQGTSDYALATWNPTEAAGGMNFYRHKDAMYYLPTEDEWVKAAYWNGTTLQTYATKAGESLQHGDGSGGSGWNYYDTGDPSGPWAVGCGSEELNGTFDMMGNVWEWMESPYSDPGYGTGSLRGQRGGSYFPTDYALPSSYRLFNAPSDELTSVGFRVASVPEPATLLLLSFGAVMLRKRKTSR